MKTPSALMPLLAMAGMMGGEDIPGLRTTEAERRVNSIPPQALINEYNRIMDKKECRVEFLISKDYVIKDADGKVSLKIYTV